MCAWVPADGPAARRRPLTSERAPARFGRLKDDTTVLVVDMDLRSEAVRQAAKSKGSCCVVC